MEIGSVTWMVTGGASRQRFKTAAVSCGARPARRRLRLNYNPRGGSAEPVYKVVHHDFVIGQTCGGLGRDLLRLLKKPPSVIDDVYADVPDTAALSAGSAARVGMGRHGLHLRARIYGLGRLP